MQSQTGRYVVRKQVTAVRLLKCKRMDEWSIKWESEWLNEWVKELVSGLVND